MNKQAGFTLIELVIVIVLLGILAATALPRFTNVENGARSAAFAGATGALSSSVSIAKAVNRTSTPTAAQVGAQFDGAGDFTLNTGAACGGAPVVTVATTAAPLPAANMSLTATFGTTTTYCVGVNYDAATGTFSKPPL